MSSLTSHCLMRMGKSVHPTVILDLNLSISFALSSACRKCWRQTLSHLPFLLSWTWHSTSHHHHQEWSNCPHCSLNTHAATVWGPSLASYPNHQSKGHYPQIEMNLTAHHLDLHQDLKIMANKDHFKPLFYENYPGARFP
jgi:hypothetical protein